MRANKLRLKNFRNYEEEEIRFDPGVNVIYGDNAQGKTNILEAVHIFSLGRSVRTVKDSELIRHGESSGQIGLDYSAYDRDSVFQIELSKKRRKVITYNELPIKKNSELLGKFNVVYFGPELSGLVKGGPRVRRRNLDMLISQLRPNYFSALSSLRQVVDSKNALLRMAEPNKTLLEIMNEKLCEYSAQIIGYRTEFLRRLAVLAAKIQKDISGGKEDLEIRYMSCIGRIDEEADISRDRLTELLHEKISAAAPRELEYKETVISPHREDLIYEINGKEARAFASQGQQKTIVLVEKLAEVLLIKEEINETPVLLLDDIMSELDKARRKFVLKNIENMQILITCTDIDDFSESVENVSEINRIYVEGGSAKEQPPREVE